MSRPTSHGGSAPAAATTWLAAKITSGMARRWGTATSRRPARERGPVKRASDPR